MARILYLEDEVWQVKGTVVRFIEKGLGHSVTLVTSTDEAKAELSSDSYDVVFLDIMLDTSKGLIQFENSGLLVAQLVLDGAFSQAGNPSTMPIIIASGVWDATIENAHGHGLTVEDMAHSLGIPEQHFLRKPFLAEEVENLLDQVLGTEENE